MGVSHILYIGILTICLDYAGQDEESRPLHLWGMSQYHMRIVYGPLIAKKECRGMRYEVKESRHEREWTVQAFNPQGEGEVYVAEFSGPDAKARATEYAAWKNGQRHSLKQLL